MIIPWNQLIALSPILVIGLTIVIIMLSISYNRNHFRHMLLTIIGLSLTIVLLLTTIWKNSKIRDINQLIYTDDFSVLYMVLIIVVSFISGLFAYTWLLHYPSYHRDEFYLLLLISSMGGILLVITNHLIVLFLGIELISLPLLGLISFSVFEKSAVVASIKYIVLSGISSAFLLFGIALIYAETGCLSFCDIQHALLSNNYVNEKIVFQSALLAMTGLIMMMVGFGFKLSFVPFHSWTPDVYQGAPSVVAMYLSISSKIAIISILIRFLLILPEQYYKILCVFLSVVSCCSMLFGSIIAIQQNNIKRILAYSSITSSGYLLTVLVAPFTDYSMSQEAIGIYLISYLLSNAGAFGVINLMSIFFNSNKEMDILSLYRGLFWSNPVLSIIFTIIILSLAGIPMTLGFIGKFYLLLIGISNKLWILSVLILISGIISIFYYLRIIITLYLSPSIDKKIKNSNSIFECFYNPTGVLVIGITFSIMIFGLYPQAVISLIHLIFCIT